MKITCNRNALLAAFSAVSGVVPSRSPKPILQNVKLTVDNGSAELSATDLEVGIRRKVLGVVADAPGSVLLPAGRFGQILKSSRDDELHIEVGDDKLTIRGLRSSFTLPLEDVGQFPDVPGFDAPGWHSLAAGDLRRLIRRTSFATDIDSARYALSGCLVERGDDFVTFVGTDGRRLAKMTVGADAEGEPSDGRPVMPLKALKLIERNIGGDGDDPARLAFDANGAMIQIDGATIYSRLVEGRFPRYTDVIPERSETTVTIDAEALRLSLEQAAITTSEESRGVDFEFSAAGLTLAAKASDVGASKVDMPLLFEAAEPIRVSMDPHYVLDALKALDDGAEVVVELTDAKSAVVLRTRDQYVYVVMPLTREG